MEMSWSTACTIVSCETTDGPGTILHIFSVRWLVACGPEKFTKNEILASKIKPTARPTRMSQAATEKTKLYLLSLIRGINPDNVIFDEVRKGLAGLKKRMLQKQTSEFLLPFACINGRVSIVRLLVEEHLASVNQARHHRDVPILQTVLDHNVDEKARDEILQIVLAHRAEVNAPFYGGHTALFSACVRKMEGAARILGSFPGIDLDQKNVFQRSQGSTMDSLDRGLGNGQAGLAALHALAYHGDADLARVLLDRGASVDITNRAGMTPLHICFDVDWKARPAGSQAPLARLLVERGARLAATNSQGQTVLQVACANEDMLPDGIGLLLGLGADPNGRGSSPFAPLVLVAQAKPPGRHAPAMARALLRAGADVNDGAFALAAMGRPSYLEEILLYGGQVSAEIYGEAQTYLDLYLQKYPDLEDRERRHVERVRKMIARPPEYWEHKSNVVQYRQEGWTLCRMCRKAEGVSRCSGCGVTAYCCREHQVANWPLHKLVCAALRR